MQTITVNDAVGQALAEEMRRDPRVLTFGEGVATNRRDLLAEFGPQRVRNTPLAEGIIAGAAAGAAAMGLRPVIDLLFAPFLTLSMDAIMNSAGKLRYLSGGQFEFPMVVLARTGAGWTVGAQHNHNLEAMFVHAPGLKVVMPHSTADYKGLLKSAIRDPNPVLFFMDMTVGYTPGPVPEGEHVVPLGQAAVLRAGRDVTLVSYSKSVTTCLAAADQLARRGIDAEVIDLRTTSPLDVDTILESVENTGRLVVVDEATPRCNIATDISALVAQQAFSSLQAPIEMVTAPHTPVPFADALEDLFIPDAQRVVNAVKSVAGWTR